MRTSRQGERLFFVVILIFMYAFPMDAGAVNPFGCDLFAASVISDTSFITCGSQGKIFLSKDNGKSFHSVESPAKNALAAISFPDASHGWIVGQGGVVLNSSDGGHTWKVQRSSVNTYLMAVDFKDRFNGCAVGADSSVIVTTDGGENWQPSPFTLTRGTGGEFNLFTVKIIDPQILIITGDMGRIFRSEDFGGTWAEAATANDNAEDSKS